MKKLLLVVALAFLVAGCGEGEVAESEGPFIGGVDGVEISFKERSPLTEFNAGEDIPVKVLLKNNGEFSIPSTLSFVRLYGVKHDSFGLPSSYQAVTGELRGAEKGFLEEGGEQEVDFGALNYNLDVRGKLDQTLRAKICYPYKTEARVLACVSSRRISEAGTDEVCSVDGEKLGSGSVSKAPVQLTSFTESLLATDEIAFTLVFENSHTGNVFGVDGSCDDFDDTVKSIDHAGLITIDMDPDTVLCKFVGEDANVGVLDVGAGAKTLVCTMPVDSLVGSNYVEEITVNVDYKYVESASVDLTILG
tara:strand:- start:6740 stop:7657 length:918 start_codon:yes stop_codon:yes gene_type:complete